MWSAEHPLYPMSGSKYHPSSPKFRYINTWLSFALVLPSIRFKAIAVAVVGYTLVWLSDQGIRSKARRWHSVVGLLAAH